MPTRTIESRLTVRQCQCPHTTCETYGFKEGTFYQGCGFNKDTAERVAACYNVCAEMDDPQEVVRALISLAKDIENMTLHHPRLLITRAEEILSHIRR